MPAVSVCCMRLKAAQCTAAALPELGLAMNAHQEHKQHDAMRLSGQQRRIAHNWALASSVLSFCMATM